jgi:hypothetical protein
LLPGHAGYQLLFDYFKNKKKDAFADAKKAYLDSRAGTDSWLSGELGLVSVGESKGEEEVSVEALAEYLRTENADHPWALYRIGKLFFRIRDDKILPKKLIQQAHALIRPYSTCEINWENDEELFFYAIAADKGVVRAMEDFMLAASILEPPCPFIQAQPRFDKFLSDPQWYKNDVYFGRNMSLVDIMANYLDRKSPKHPMRLLHDRIRKSLGV